MIRCIVASPHGLACARVGAPAQSPRPAAPVPQRRAVSRLTIAWNWMILLHVCSSQQIRVTQAGASTTCTRRCRRRRRRRHQRGLHHRARPLHPRHLHPRRQLGAPRHLAPPALLLLAHRTPRLRRHRRRDAAARLPHARNKSHAPSTRAHRQIQAGRRHHHTAAASMIMEPSRRGL
jgi:hypothetical protein